MRRCGRGHTLLAAQGGAALETLKALREWADNTGLERLRSSPLYLRPHIERREITRIFARKLEIPQPSLNNAFPFHNRY